jgi:uncharacterized protein (DUF983 family)
MVTDTKPSDVKCCSKCKESKLFDKFIKKRNICKECANASKKAKYDSFVIDDTTIQTCNVCNKEKSMSSFIKKRNKCKDCHNECRRKQYDENPEHRIELIRQASTFKHNKVLENQKVRLEEQTLRGIDNKQCKKCSQIKAKDNFRHNRLKCKDCERDEPIEKLRRNIRGRIHAALNKKELHTIEYLGVNSIEYFKWLLNYDERYNLDNKKEWHIDHVIPLSKFNLEIKEEQLIAFNWRNTMPLSVRENLSKNNKILTLQIEQHYKHLSEYQTNNNIEMPQEFIDLFAKYLVVGDTLRAFTTTHT